MIWSIFLRISSEIAGFEAVYRTKFSVVEGPDVKIWTP